MIITEEKYWDNITTLQVYLRFMLDFDINIPSEQYLASLTNYCFPTLGSIDCAFLCNSNPFSTFPELA